MRWMWLSAALWGCAGSALHETPVDLGVDRGEAREETDNLSAEAGEWLVFEVDVPWAAGTLDVFSENGAGDADLYVRFGEAPTPWDHDCASQNAGNDERCEIVDPVEGTWYVGVFAYTTFAGLNLDWAVTEGDVSGGLGSLHVGGIDVYAGEVQTFPFEVPGMAARVTVSLSGGVGNADLWVRRDGEPMCVSAEWGNDESCVLEFPWEGEIEIAVVGTESAFDVTLDVESLIGDVPDW